MSWAVKMQLTGIMLVLLAETAKQAAADTYRLGMLSPRRHIRLGWDVNAAAATMAIDRAKRDGILTGNDIKILYRDDQCSSKIAAGQAVEFHNDDDIHAFIGPPCSTATKSAGLLASYWNTPMFSQASTDPALGDKSVYSTLVRMSPPFSKMGGAVAAIFEKFEWHRLVMVSQRPIGTRDVFCDYASRSIETFFRNSNVTLADWIQVDKGKLNLDDIMLRITRRGRIVVLCLARPDEHSLLVRAHAAAMTQGDFVFLALNYLPPSNIRTPWEPTDQPLDELILAYRAVLQISLSSLAGPSVDEFRRQVPVEMTKEPWFYNGSLEAGRIGSEYALFLHDIVYLYLLALNDTLENNYDPRNGTHMFWRATTKQFIGVSGDVRIDKNGDRDPNYWLWHKGPDVPYYTAWADIRMAQPAHQRLEITTEGVWPGGELPNDSPKCGFFRELCPTDNSQRDYAIIGSLVAVFISLAAVCTWYYMKRKRGMEEELQSMLWKIQEQDVEFLKTSKHDSNLMSQLSFRSMSVMRLDAGSDVTTEVQGAIHDMLVVYRGALAVTWPIYLKDPKELSRQDLFELNQMRHVQHDNVNPFLGACLQPGKQFIISNYCSRGTLQDILGNDDIKLDWLFKCSMCADVANGMGYIHNSPLVSNGNLTSDTCMVDNRWVVKVDCYGVQRLRQTTTAEVGEYQHYKEMLWLSPELLRQPVELRPHNGSREADVYAYGLLLQEVFYRSLPYFADELDPKDVIERVKALPTSPTSAFRPRLRTTDSLEPGAVQLMQQCWAELPFDRPTFNDIKKALRQLNKGRKVNILDNMLSMMEKYANNLEEIVQSRTSELVEEKTKTDLLLHQMLPKTVAENLKRGNIVQPESFETVTIFFSDIVGFTALSSESNPLQVVDLLNDLYTLFDGIITNHDVYKVETIGDAYMIASGLPTRTHRHAAEIANVSLDLLNAVYTSFRIRHYPQRRLLLRIGIHTGPCVAGVVGLKMPRYCLFGDTVNTASRMESNGQALRIHASTCTYEALLTFGGYQLVKRGDVSMKGKGMQTTYWLVGKENYENPLPGLSDLDQLIESWQ